MKKDYIFTFMTEFIVLASGILVYKLAAEVLGKEGFSEYALGMKTAAFIQPLLLLGLGVGVPRYIAYARGSENEDRKEPDNYFAGGFLSIVSILAVFVLLMTGFKEFFAHLFFGDNFYVYLIYPLCLMLSGLSFHAICYSYYRGNLKMLHANLLRLSHGVVPLIALYYSGNQAFSALRMIGILWIFIFLISFLFILPGIRLDKSMLPGQTAELLKYGIKRFPADIGLSAILILPATFTAHIAGVKEAGFIAFGLSLLNMTGALFAPLGLVLLPKASRMVAQGDFDALNKKILRILIFATIVAFAIVFVFVFLTESIISIYLGRGFLEIANILRVITIGVLPFAIYICMRSVIDAFYEKAINTKNVSISFIVFLLGSSASLFFTKNYYHILISLVGGVSILGILTLLEIKTILMDRRQ